MEEYIQQTKNHFTIQFNIVYTLRIKSQSKSRHIVEGAENVKRHTDGKEVK